MPTSHASGPKAKQEIGAALPLSLMFVDGVPLPKAERRDGSWMEDEDDAAGPLRDRQTDICE